MFKVDLKLDGPVPVAVPDGRLDTVNSKTFADHIGHLLNDGEYLTIDFSRCNYLSSSGLRILMAAHKQLASKGGGLFLAALPAEVVQVIEMTGLQSVFELVKDPDEAGSRVLALSARKPGPVTVRLAGFDIAHETFNRTGGPVRVWNQPELVGFDELVFSAGIGSPAENLFEDEGRLGFFMTAMQCSAYFPFDREMPGDYRVVADPGSGGVFLRKALSFRSSPDGLFCFRVIGESTLGACLDALVTLFDGKDENRVGGLILVDGGEENPSVSLVILTASENPDPETERIFSECREFTTTTAGGVPCLGMRFLLSDSVNPEKEDSFPDFIRRSLTIETIEGVELIDLESQPGRLMGWAFWGDTRIDSGVGRMLVDTVGDFAMPPYGNYLTRKLYTDSSRLIIKPLHGGYSALTFQVESFDREGRRLRPTVLKMANRPMITREADRCRQYSMPYILNNSAMVLGTAFHCDAGALRYNFVGIGGEESQLKWLAHYYESWPIERLVPLFDKIFIRILKPWYGQPVGAKIRPYADHDPTFTFFPQLYESARSELGIDPYDKYFRPGGQGDKRLNPYWFLKFVYPERRDWQMDYYTSICHGDLNMQNILLDEDRNVYLIDFSETRPRSAISDFARLEAIFMIEHAHMETPGDLQDMIEFTSDFYSVKRLDEKPAAFWKGRHPEPIARNVAMTLRMREYALETVKGNPDLTPYILALLEWVLPVVCYGSAPASVKMLSACIAGRLCEHLLDLRSD